MARPGSNTFLFPSRKRGLQRRGPGDPLRPAVRGGLAGRRQHPLVRTTREGHHATLRFALIGDVLLGD